MRTPCHYCFLDTGRSDQYKVAGKLADAELYPIQIFTVHDLRGCVHVCWAHANWRRTKGGGGHGQDCPLREDRDNIRK
jgi:hypothetical protein